MLLISTLLMGMGIAQAELTALEQQILADHQSMQSMSVEERMAFRKIIFKQENVTERRRYNSTYKDMSVAGLLPELNNAIKTSKKANIMRVPGTNITYDTGAAIATNPGLGSQSFGNRFNTGFNPAAGMAGAINPVEDTGSVTMITVNMAGINGTAAFLTVFTVDPGDGGTANGISSFNQGGLALGLNTVTVGLPFSNGPFIIGVWQGDAAGGAAGTAQDVVAVDSNSVNGQGFHAVSLNDISGTGLTSIPNLNAIIRVSGNVLSDTVPVELMNFEID